MIRKNCTTEFKRGEINISLKQIILQNIFEIWVPLWFSWFSNRRPFQTIGKTRIWCECQTRSVSGHCNTVLEHACLKRAAPKDKYNRQMCGRSAPLVWNRVFTNYFLNISQTSFHKVFSCSTEITHLDIRVNEKDSGDKETAVEERNMKSCFIKTLHKSPLRKT